MPVSKETIELDYLLPGEKGPSGPICMPIGPTKKELKLSKQKQKRFDKFVEKETKKSDRKILFEKVRNTAGFSSTQIQLLRSSKTLGRVKFTAKEKLRLSFLQSQASIPITDVSIPLFIDREVSEFKDFKQEDTVVDVEVNHSLENTANVGDNSMQTKYQDVQSLGIVARAYPVSTVKPVQVFETDGRSTVELLGDSSSIGSGLKSGLVGKSLSILKKRALKRKKGKGSLQKAEKIPNTLTDSSSSESDNDSQILGKKSNWNSNIVDGEKMPGIQSETVSQVVNIHKIEKTYVLKPVEQQLIPKTPIYVHVERDSEIQLARMRLPVFAEEQQIMETILNNDVTILCGSTGSGKTTQVPQFLYEAGFGSPTHPLFSGMIGVTQPRRVAAVSMAERVAFEMGLNNGEIAHQIRWDSKVTQGTRIKFMTDGILLRELNGSSSIQRGDLLLTQYSAIIIDEAHERTVGTDVLIGWLTRIVKLRNSATIRGVLPLKLIIMSATLRVDDFTLNKTLFPQIPPPVVTVEGRQHKVVVHYNKHTGEEYISECFKKCVKIHTKLPSGGVLVFVTGQNEVMLLVKKLVKRFAKPGVVESLHDTVNGGGEPADFFEIDDSRQFDGKGDAGDDFDELEEEDEDAEDPVVQILGDGEEEIMDEPTQQAQAVYVLPLYSMLPTEEQLKIFLDPPEGARLIVVATNIAETSLTIPGIRYVVDCGKVKERVYDSQSGMQNFRVNWTSKASSDQRAGRAGRMGVGHCYRIFSSNVFSNYFGDFGVPEIQRVPIDGVVLQMKSMGIVNVVGFPFPTPPEKQSLVSAEKLLLSLDALKRDSKMEITDLGRKMVQLPVSPRYAKMLLVAIMHSLQMVPYIVAIVAGLSVGDPFVRDGDLFYDPKKPDGLEEEEEDADTPAEVEDDREERSQKRGSFFRVMQGFAGNCPKSDVICMLKAIGAYEFEVSKNGDLASLHRFCESHFVRLKTMQEIMKLKSQLTNLMKKMDESVKISTLFSSKMSPPTAKQESLIRQIFLSGFGDQIAILDETKMCGYGKNALPVYSTMWSNTPEDFVIHPSSTVFRTRPASKWIIYDQILGKEERFGADGVEIVDVLKANQRPRRWLKGITFIEESWISNLKSPLCKYGKVLEQPVPHYILSLDMVKGYRNPTYGPKSWPLPIFEHTLDTIEEQCLWFAKCLLEGKVQLTDSTSPNMFGLLMPHLLAKPTILAKSWAKGQARVSKLMRSFTDCKVINVATLISMWKSNSKFMIEEYLLWIPEAAHSIVRKSWPPVTIGTLGVVGRNFVAEQQILKLLKLHSKGFVDGPDS